MLGKCIHQPCLQVNHLQGGSDHRPVTLDVLSSCLKGLHDVSNLELIVGVNLFGADVSSMKMALLCFL